MFCNAVGAKRCKNSTLSDCNIQTEFKIALDWIGLENNDRKYVFIIYRLNSFT